MRSKTPLIVGGGVLALAVLGGGLYALLAPSGKPAPAPATVAAGGGSMAPAAGASEVLAAAAAPAPVSPPPTAAPAGPFDPAREFERIAAAQTPGFEVTASTAKPTFRIGKDELAFSVKSAREGHLYVLTAGTDGSFIQLFPNEKARNNHVNAGQTLKLPDANWHAPAGGPPGVDQFIAIVSKHPRDFAAAGMKIEGGFGEFAKELAAEVAARHAGPGSAFAGKPVCDAGVPCDDEYGAAVFSSQEVN
jgi:hypothetical protein